MTYAVHMPDYLVRYGGSSSDELQRPLTWHAHTASAESVAGGGISPPAAREALRRTGKVDLDGPTRLPDPLKR